MRRAFFALLVCLAPAWACNDNLNPSESPGKKASSSSGEGGESSSSGEPSGASSSSGGGESSSSSGSSSGESNLGCPGEPVPLRVVAANLTGESQKYDAAGVSILQGLKPDVALVQEMNYRNNSQADLQSFVNEAFGSEFSYVRGSGHIPNGVVSRYPIVDSGHITDSEVGDRDFVWARIDVPGERHLLAFSVHLLTNNSRRGTQARGLMSAISSVAREGDYVLLGGDFNTPNRNGSGISSISERFITSGPYPADEDRVDGTNNSRQSPYDWVVADRDLHELAGPTEIGSLRFAAGLVFDSRVFSDLSLVPPVRREASNNLQHMAVVRTFTFCQ